MVTAWFCLVAWMLAMYVVLDGFDLGAGIIHLYVARSDGERRRVLRSIGPVWGGNEVWLIATGGTLYFAFPVLYAASFSGFYLPLMIVLWLFMLRGISIEFRNHMNSPVWQPLWDLVFAASSAALALTFGAALGNVMRGVPLDRSGDFFEPLWTDLTLAPPTGILDWYTIVVGVAALAALALHGALWIVMKTEDEVSVRARSLARRIWWAVAALTLSVTVVTFRVQPHVLSRLSTHLWGLVFPGLALSGLAAAGLFTRRRRDAAAFFASCGYLVGMMASAAFGIYPFVLPANTDQAFGLTAAGSAAGLYGLRVGLAWWTPGIMMATGYSVFLYRRFAGKVHLEETGY